MSYRFDFDVGYGRLRHYTTQAIGGLEARTKTAALAVPLKQFRDEVVAARAAREAADDAVLVATARVRVGDVDWDQSIGVVSSRAYELAKKDASADPYVTLFGRIDAKRAKDFGPAKAVVVGQTVVKDGRRLTEFDLTNELTALEAATQELLASKQRWDDADDALFEPRRAKKRLIGRLNELIAVTEAGILTAFPGRNDIVTAILQPWFERRRPKGSAPDVDSPDIDDEGDDDADLTGGGTP